VAIATIPFSTLLSYHISAKRQQVKGASAPKGTLDVVTWQISCDKQVETKKKHRQQMTMLLR
jgi:hypothetical protein